MRAEDYEYDLPPSLIAAHPVEPRDASRLMVLRRADPSSAPEHRVFSELPEILRTGDVLVLNETRVIPARIRARRPNGGQAEILLTEPEPGPGERESGGGYLWRALVKPGRKLPAGSVVGVAAPADLEGLAGFEDFPAFIHIERELGEGERVVRIETGLPLEAFLNKYGEPPLPPYIVAARKVRPRGGPAGPRRRRVRGDDEDDFDAESFAGGDDEEGGLGRSGSGSGSGPGAAARGAIAPEDWERYQTVFAREPGSVAAPTAGLHFTPELLERLGARGVEIRRVTLHVGPGTFAPVKVDDPREHPIHEERYSVRAEEAAAIEAARRDPARRVIAVGTTVARVLETLGAGGAPILPPTTSHDRPDAPPNTAIEGRTRLMILPGHEFQAIDGLITNFHLPRSTLLMLVSAFAGRERVLAAYAEAIRLGYRFYSYGDAMWLI